MAEALLKEKTWDKEMEKPIIQEWRDKQVYKFDSSSARQIYSIDTPPPYVNAPVHIGQVTTYILMDMFARYHRMMGDNVLFPLGLDRNGLPIEVATERKFKVNLNQVPREKFIEMCKQVLEECSLTSTESFFMAGIGFNSWNIGNGIGDVYLTDSPEYRSLTQDSFIDLWNKGLIYEGEYPTNFCTGCQTTLADAEVEYEDRPTTFNDIIFVVKETNERLTIATTRPELLCSCKMVVFHPSDERYKHLEGKKATVPAYDFEVPIKSHTVADPEKGTGLVMMCSYGDSADVRFFREMNLSPVFAINADGRMNENAGPLNGLKIKAAREKIIELLKEKGLLTAQKQIVHPTPICERSKDPIEFIAMKEFYLKQVEFKGEIQNISDKLNFYAPESKQILDSWINSVSIDWPISKRRYYATEVPLWYCEKCGETVVPPKGKYYRPWREPPPVEKCKCGSTQFRGETRVFDTWFDSSISPLYVLQYSRNDKFFEKAMPCTLRPQGKEIVRTWLYYTLLKCYLLTNKSIFKEVFIHHHIVDAEGEKMSKSKGNVIDPQEVMKRYGAEPLRLWAVVEGNLDKQDFRCSYDRVMGTGKTLIKLWNVSRFISMFPQVKKEISKVKLTETDKWIIQEVNQLVHQASERYPKYDFHNPVINIKHFIWETFASHYLELVKNRAYNSAGAFTAEEQEAAVFALHYCLERILRLLAPVVPIITSKIYKDLYGGDIHFLSFPKIEMEFAAGFASQELEELNSTIWKKKKDSGLSLKAEISEIQIPEKFKSIEKDFISAHSIKNIKYSAEVNIVLAQQQV